MCTIPHPLHHSLSPVASYQYDQPSLTWLRRPMDILLADSDSLILSINPVLDVAILLVVVIALLLLDWVKCCDVWLVAMLSVPLSQISNVKQHDLWLVAIFSVLSLHLFTDNLQLPMMTLNFLVPLSLLLQNYFLNTPFLFCSI